MLVIIAGEEDWDYILYKGTEQKDEDILLQGFGFENREAIESFFEDVSNALPTKAKVPPKKNSKVASPKTPTKKATKAPVKPKAPIKKTPAKPKTKTETKPKKAK